MSWSSACESLMFYGYLVPQRLWQDGEALSYCTHAHDAQCHLCLVCSTRKAMRETNNILAYVSLRRSQAASTAISPCCLVGFFAHLCLSRLTLGFSLTECNTYQPACYAYTWLSSDRPARGIVLFRRRPTLRRKMNKTALLQKMRIR